MDKARKFLDSTGGKALGIALAIAGVAGLYFAGRSWFGKSEAARMAGERVFICSETGKSFNHTMKVGEAIPVICPHTGRNTGYPGELCFWTADGGVKTEPTVVLLRNLVGERGPTFCPDCGRLVRAQNPRPENSSGPPPRKEQYKETGRSDRARE